MRGDNVLITNADLDRAQETLSPRGIGNDGKHTVKEDHTATNLNTGKVTKAPNFSNQTGNQNVRQTIVNDKPVFMSSRSNMDEALDTLWTIERYLDEETQEELNFRTDSGFWGTVKNLFFKFLGLFNSAVKENRTNALNQQIDDVLKKICKNKDFYEKVLVSVMNDRDIDEELKTTCFRFFSDKPEFQKELFQKIEKPSSDVLLCALKYWKKEIKNGKLFGNDVCDQWLSPLMNDKNTTEKTKLDLYTFFDDNSEIQDKLFKSLKNPPNEIRKKFLERHKEEIVSGKIFGFSQDRNPYGIYGESEIKDSFLKKEYPLATLFLAMANARRDLDKSIFADKKNWKLMQNSDQQKEYMKAACSLTKEQVFQSLESIKTIEYDKVKKDQNSNIKKVLDFLKAPESGNIDIPEEDPKGSFYPTVVKDTLRSMHYSFVFGKTKIDLSKLSKLKTDDPKVFFQALKKQLWNAQKECLLDENQLEQLVNFIFYSPSQGYCASQLGDICYKPFDGNMSVQVAFNRNEGPVVTIKSESTYNFIGFIGPLDLPISDNEAPRVHTSGTLKLTYESPINASNANKYEISVEEYSNSVTFT